MGKRKSTFKAYTIFSRHTNEKVATIKATRIEYDFTRDICTFFFGRIAIGEINLNTHYVYNFK